MLDVEAATAEDLVRSAEPLWDSMERAGGLSTLGAGRVLPHLPACLGVHSVGCGWRLTRLLMRGPKLIAKHRAERAAHSELAGVCAVVLRPHASALCAASRARITAWSARPASAFDSARPRLLAMAETDVIHTPDQRVRVCLRAPRPARRCRPGRAARPHRRRGLRAGPGLGRIHREQASQTVRTGVTMTAADLSRTAGRLKALGERARQRISMHEGGALPRPERSAVACAARGGGVGYRRLHQAWMITSWARPVSMV